MVSFGLILILKIVCLGKGIKQGKKLVSSDALAVEVVDIVNIVDIVDIVGIIDTVDIFSNLEQCYALIEAISKTLVNHPLN